MITILGPTASGKTAFAVALAVELDAEIISADSRQVYRRMDIGTGKDLAEYNIGDKFIPYHLIDIAEPGTKYNLFEYQKDFTSAYNDIVKRKKLPILCGGTGLYIEAVLNGYNLLPVPENIELRSALANKTIDELKSQLLLLKNMNGTNMHNTTDVDTAKRAIRAIEIETYYKNHPELTRREAKKIDSVIIGIDIDRNERRRKISLRLRQRLDNGMLDEVKGLLNEGIKADDLIYYGLEYKYLTEYLTGRISYNDMFRSLEIAIHQFAKRQMTWFRGMERRGFKINWIDANMPLDEKVTKAKDIYQKACKDFRIKTVDE